MRASLDSIFLAAIELSGSDRERFLETACGDDVQQRRKLDALLSAHNEAGSFLETAPEGVSALGELDGDTADSKPVS